MTGRAEHGRPKERSGLLGRFERLYGAGPLHLLGHLIVIAIAAYALSIMFEARFAPRPLNLVLWLLGGAVLHDAVFLPLYSALGVATTRIVGADGGRRVPVLNHLRTPFIVAAVLFLVFLPRITDRQPQNFVNALGHPPPDYLARWLLCVVVLFGGSALLYLARWLRAGPRHEGASTAPGDVAA